MNVLVADRRTLPSTRPKEAAGARCDTVRCLPPPPPAPYCATAAASRLAGMLELLNDVSKPP
jgi:hypothetical protein